MTKKTSKKVATKASKVLNNKQTWKKSKTGAWSALSQYDTRKKTSQKAASKSSDVMKDWRTSKNSKSTAASALSQKTKKKK